MPSTRLRQTVLPAARRVVVKVGTQLITEGDDETVRIDARVVGEIARQVSELTARGVEVTLVSSGAIGCGCAELGLDKKPRDVAEQQAVAAIGQRRLLTYWADAFSPHGLGVGQVLLTRSDFDDRVRFLNIRNCIAQLHALRCVPILNENDTVAVDEIRFGDNDLLAALTCNALRADALVLLTVVSGLLNEAGEVIDLVESVVDFASLTRGKSKWGTGGMSTKLEAARLVTEAGEVAVIASGREPDVLVRVLSGEAGVGTVVMPAQRKLDSRARWIGLTARPAGSVTINDGAADVLRKRGKSLLAVGVTEVTGRFERGEVLLIRDGQGREVARGLTNYAADELRLIMGKKTNQFEKILGRQAYAEVIHCDNMVVSGEAPGT
jgi:glutamate 5-kinase